MITIKFSGLPKFAKLETVGLCEGLVSVSGVVYRGGKYNPYGTEGATTAWVFDGTIWAQSFEVPFYTEV